MVVALNVTMATYAMTYIADQVMHSRDESMLARVFVGPALMCDNWFSLTPGSLFCFVWYDSGLIAWLQCFHLLGEILNYFKRLFTIFLELLCIKICEVLDLLPQFLICRVK